MGMRPYFSYDEGLRESTRRITTACPGCAADDLLFYHPVFLFYHPVFLFYHPVFLPAAPLATALCGNGTVCRGSFFRFGGKLYTLGRDTGAAVLCCAGEAPAADPGG